MKRILLAAFALLAALGFTALGFWQIERREWKLDLIARVDAGIHAPPELLTNWRGFDARAQEYRRVHLRGVFLCDRETLVQAVTERGAGFWVLTPFRTASGIALVNRGFVPSAKSARWCGPDSKSDVIGLVRANEPRGAFLRTNDAAADRWYSRDVVAIARARGLAPVAPFFVDADATPNPGGYPVGGLTVVAFRNNHLIYALTWFALAGLSAAAGAFIVLRRPKRR